MTTQRHLARVDDDDEDINDFDPAYFPRKVYKDGRGPRVQVDVDRWHARLDAARPARRPL